jgi:ABC-type Fe3+/spermidine/putrescine transport system ATPase subunit
MALADRIAVMDQGRILQIGSAEDLYMRPAHPKVAQFMGSANWFAGTVVADGVVETDLGRLRTAARQNAGLPRGSAVTIAVRPEGIRLIGGPVDADFDSNILCGQVISETYFGDHRLYAVQAGAKTLLAKLPFDQRPAGIVHLVIPESAILVFPAENNVVVADGAPRAVEGGMLGTRALEPIASKRAGGTDALPFKAGRSD